MLSLLRNKNYTNAWHHPAVQVAALLLIGAAILLPSLGQETRVDGREARHAEIAREMVESGQYAVPHALGRPYIDKAPMFNWIVALLFRLTGRVDFLVARFPSAVCALGAMLGVYVLGRRWFSAPGAIFAALIWATSQLVVEWGRVARSDMMMACLIVYGTLIADLAATAEGDRKRLLIWSAACVVTGGALLSKGPYALLFFSVAVMALWRARRGRWLPPARFIILGGLIVSFMFAVWLVPAELSRPGHARELLGYQFGEALKEHPKRFYLYWDQIFLGTVPWGVLALGATYYAVRRLKRRTYDCALVPALVVVVGLVVLTFIVNKRAHYMLPVLPFWSLFLGGFLADALNLPTQIADRAGEERIQVPRWMFEWPILFCLLVVLCVGAVCPVFWVAGARGGKAIGVAFLAIAAAFAAWGVVALLRTRTSQAVAMLFSGCVILNIFASSLLVPHYLKPSDELLPLRQIAEMIPRSSPLASYRVKEAYVHVKLNRPVVFAQNEEDLRQFLGGPGARYIIMDGKQVEAVAELSSRPLSEVFVARYDGREVAVLRTEPTGAARAGRRNRVAAPSESSMNATAFEQTCQLSQCLTTRTLSRGTTGGGRPARRGCWLTEGLDTETWFWSPTGLWARLRSRRKLCKAG